MLAVRLLKVVERQVILTMALLTVVVKANHKLILGAMNGVIGGLAILKNNNHTSSLVASSKAPI